MHLCHLLRKVQQAKQDPRGSRDEVALAHVGKQDHFSQLFSRRDLVNRHSTTTIEQENAVVMMPFTWRLN